MKDPKLGRRYAEALYSAASDQGVVDDVVLASETVLEPLVKDQTFQVFWLGRQIPLPKKLELIDEVFKEVPVLLRNFLRLLLDKKREEVLVDMLPALREIHDRERGIVRAVLTTAIEISEDDMAPFKELVTKLLGGKVELTRKVNESLIAGFTLRYGDKIIDGSVARSISEIRRRLSA